MRQRNTPLMIFAAGLGTRMRELTANRPKPLIPVLGRSLLDRALDLAEEVKAAPIVVNTHYLGGQIREHLAGRDIAISDEADEILETGGGLRKALPLLGAGPVMTLNPDVIWRGPNPLAWLQRHWDGTRMDALLLLLPRAGLRGRTGGADFRLDSEGRITRDKAMDGHVFAGAHMVNTARLAEISERVFSLNLLWDRLIVEGRAHGVVWPGEWCDVGSPEGLAEAEEMLSR